MKRTVFEGYRKALDAITVGAQRDLNVLVNEVLASELSGEVLEQALIDGMHQIAYDYGNVSALAAEDFYLQMRPESLGEFTVYPADPPDYWESVRAVKHVLPRADGDPRKTRDFLSDAMSRMVQMPARKTVQLAAEMDRASGARWARVPAGGKTCAFCYVLASRGFEHKSENAALYTKSGDEYHNNCRCTAVPGWGDNPEVEGFDPEAMYRVYQQSIVTDGFKATLSNMRSQFPDVLTDGDVVKE